MKEHCPLPLGVKSNKMSRVPQPRARAAHHHLPYQGGILPSASSTPAPHRSTPTCRHAAAGRKDFFPGQPNVPTPGNGVPPVRAVAVLHGDFWLGPRRLEMGIFGQLLLLMRVNRCRHHHRFSRHTFTLLGLCLLGLLRLYRGAIALSSRSRADFFFMLEVRFEVGAR